MNCEDVELELSSGEPGVEARAHLEGCEGCRQTAKLLGLATLPALSDAERLLLNGLTASVQREWRASHQPRRRGRGLGQLALAAGLGALVAGGAVWQLMPRPQPVVQSRTETVFVTPPEVPVLEASDELNLSDDEVFFDVGWPSPTAGDL